MVATVKEKDLYICIQHSPMLPQPESGRVDCVVHISDTHIRSGDRIHSRYDEYANVFENLIQKLQEVPEVREKRAIAVLTGDVFHHKCKIESSGIHLYSYLTQKISEFCPLYIISGNHDVRQDTPDIPDMISGFFTENMRQGGAFVNKNVAYLCDTGVFYVGKDDARVGFGFVNVKDSLKLGDGVGRSLQLPVFPIPKDASVKIALFHGTVAQKDEYESNTTYPIGWFKGFDYGMFGDIHRQQVNVEIFEDETLPFVWGYSGSVIQQNYGEPLCDHGFLVWNLREKTQHFVRVPNNIGFLKIHHNVLTQTWTVYHQKLWIPIDELYNLYPDVFPKNLKTRILDETSDHAMKQWHDWCSFRNIVYTNTASINLNSFNENESTGDSMTRTMTDFSGLNSLEVWKECLLNDEKSCLELDTFPLMISELLHDPGSMCRVPTHLNEFLPASIVQKIEKKNTEIEGALQKYSDIQTSTLLSQRKGNFSLQTIHFQWILCYGDDCFFDFRKLSGKVGMISGRNGWGKSSFLETICIALFGQGIGSRTNKNTSSAILCAKCPPKFRSSTRIQFTLEGKVYEIYRCFRKTPANEAKLRKDKIEVKDMAVNTVMKSGSAAESWISENVGDCGRFLLSSLISQNQDNDFLSMKSQEQFDILNKCLNLNAIKSKTDLLKTAHTSFHYIAEHVNTLCDTQCESVHEANGTEAEIEAKQVELGYQMTLTDVRYKELQAKLKTFPSGQSFSQWKGSLDEQFQYFYKDYESYTAVLNHEKVCLEKKKRLESLYQKLLCVFEVFQEEPPYVNSFQCKKYKFPSVTEEEYQQEYGALQNEMREMQSSQFESVVVQDTIDAQHALLAAAEGILKNRQRYFNTIKEEYDHLESEHESSLRQLDKYVHEEITKPSSEKVQLEEQLKWFTINTVPYAQCKKFIKKREAFLERANELKKVCALKKQAYEKHSSLLGEIQEKTESTPFNPHCEACSHQPIRIQLAQVLKENTSLKQEYHDAICSYKDHMKEHDVDKIQESIALNTQFCKKYENIDINHVNRLIEQWDVYTKQREEKLKMLERKDTIKKKLERLDYDACSRDICFFTQLVASVKHECNEVIDYMHRKKECETKKRWLERLKKEWTLYIQKGPLSLQVLRSKIAYNYAKRVRIFCEASCTAQKKDIEDEIESVRSSQIQYKTQVALQTQELEKIQKSRKVHEVYKLYLDEIQERYKFLKQAHSSFENMRSWMFTQKIIPELVHSTNVLVANMLQSSDRSIMLQGCIRDKTIQWSMIDGGNTIYIEKASGFQRFILGLALRMSLSCIGVSTVSCCQLFLDEGFVACDAYNIQKVPKFIHSLLGIYDSLVLMSHLETVQDAVDVNIPIVRENDTSFIRF